MSKICVLGAGMVGGFIAHELADSYQVSLADINESNLNKSPIKLKKTVDFRNPHEIQHVINNCDLVIGAVPGFLGYEVAKTVLSSGKNYVDISFFPEDPFSLKAIANEHNCFAAIDCGIAPGFDNMILGYHNAFMKVESFICYVGGLPKYPTEPFKYKAPFSPIDVIEEYTRPARLVENGNIVIKDALSDPEIISFDTVGNLEAFNTDGLRTLLQTMIVPDMKEKTLRYPGHRDQITQLNEMGFFSTEFVVVNDTKFKPIDLTASVLLPQWKLKENEQEFTVMRVIVSGIENKRNVTYTYDIYDEFNVQQKATSMSRTTGYTCMAVAEGFIQNLFNQKGIITPEQLTVTEQTFAYVVEYLSKKGIQIQVKKT